MGGPRDDTLCCGWLWHHTLHMFCWWWALTALTEGDNAPHPHCTTPYTTWWSWSDNNFTFLHHNHLPFFVKKLCVVHLALNCKCTWSNQYPHLPIIIAYWIAGLYSAKLRFSLLTSWRTHHLFGHSKDQIYGVQFLRLGSKSFFQNQWLQCLPGH